MSELGIEQQQHTMRSVRLDTLVRLRWLAVLGQSAAVLVVHDGFDFDVPFWACLAVIAVYGAVNVVLRLRFRWNQRLEPQHAAWLLGARHHRARGAAVPHRRAAEPVRLPVRRAGADFGGRAAARLTLMLGRARHRLRDAPRVRALSAALARGGAAAAAAALHRSACGSRCCSRSATSASMRGRSSRNRASSPTRSSPPSSCSPASTTSPSSTALPPPPLTNWARRSPPSSWSPSELEREIEPGSRHVEDIRLLREQAAALQGDPRASSPSCGDRASRSSA